MEDVVETHPAIQISVDHHSQHVELLIRETAPHEMFESLTVKFFWLLYFLQLIFILRYLGHKLVIDFPQAESFVEKLLGEPTFSLRYFKPI